MSELTMKEYVRVDRDLREKILGPDGEEWWKNLKKFLRREETWGQKGLLASIGTITVPAMDKFTARDCFVVDTSDGAEVKIGYVGNNFKSWFLDKVEEPKGETRLSYHRLCKASPYGSILEELGDESDTTLADIWELLKLQPQGGGGVFLTNGGATVFDVPDINGVFRAVYVYWGRCGADWGVNAYSADLPFVWREGRRFFSRNS